MKLNLLVLTVFISLLLTGCNKNDTKTIENKTVQETKTEQIKTETTSANTLTSDKNTETVEIKCKGMTCSGCEDKISTEVKKLNGVKDVIADSKTKITRVVYSAGEISKQEIEKAINKAGYDTETSKSDNPHDCSTEGKEKKTNKKM